MKNRYGLDVSYSKEKINQILRDINNYKPDEFARQLVRIATAANPDVLKEVEFKNIADGDL